MKILLIKPQEAPIEMEIRHTLEDMQHLVGGIIQAIYPFNEEVALICNDEAKLLNLPFNRALRNPETGEIYDIICGTFFLCGCPANSANFTSLTRKQIKRYFNYYQNPELILKTSSGLIIL